MDSRSVFRKLHEAPFLLPNPWDAGSAKILASLGFSTLATTSSGFANSLGREDGGVSREEAIDHAAALAKISHLPINADLENGFGDDAEAVAITITRALETGIAGASIEDFGGGQIYPIELATERIRAAVEANRKSTSPLVLTARSENFIRGNPDLGDTISRLQAFQAAGADVLYAPGLTSLEDIRALVVAVDRPVNVLLMPGGPTVPELFQAGATRVSTGGAIALAAQSAIVDAANELKESGTYAFWTNALSNASAVRGAIAAD